MQLPNIGFSEILGAIVYLATAHYLIRTRVKDELKNIDDKINRLSDIYDKRLDSLELYIRRIDAISEINRKMLLSDKIDAINTNVERIVEKDDL